MGLQQEVWQRKQEDDLQAWASVLVSAASHCSGAPSAQLAPVRASNPASKKTVSKTKASRLFLELPA